MLDILKKREFDLESVESDKNNRSNVTQYFDVGLDLSEFVLNQPQPNLLFLSLFIFFFDFPSLNPLMTVKWGTKSKCRLCGRTNAANIYGVTKDGSQC